MGGIGSGDGVGAVGWGELGQVLRWSKLPQLWVQPCFCPQIDESTSIKAITFIIASAETYRSKSMAKEGGATARSTKRAPNPMKRPKKDQVAAAALSQSEVLKTTSAEEVGD